MATIDLGTQAARTAPGRPIYFAVWRWHFYAGLYVVPFLIMLATTGLIMLWTSWLYGQNGERTSVTAALPVAVSVQAEAARAAVPDGVLKTYVAPLSPTQVAVFRVDGAQGPRAVMVDPGTGEVAGQMAWRGTLYDIASDIHGSLLIGTLGDRLIEIAASLGMVLIVTGVVLWWPRGGTRFRDALLPSLRGGGRAAWRGLHSAVGVWTALVLALFLISGLSWAGIWGERVVQAWSTFPAGKWGSGVPLSDVTHASMNAPGEKSVPWTLEQTPMPASDPHAGHDMAAPAAPAPEAGTFIDGLVPGQAPNVDQVASYAAAQNFVGRFQLAFPQGETGVWSITHDSMSNDGPNPAADRTIHIDRYDGRVLADFGYADYGPYAKAMAWGIAIHEGDMGWWAVALNTLFCLAVIGLCVSGIVMWWLRRPVRAGRLFAPPMPRNAARWPVAALIALVPAVLFPLAGLTLLAVLVLDWLVVSRLPGLRRALG